MESLTVGQILDIGSKIGVISLLFLIVWAFLYEKVLTQSAHQRIVAQGEAQHARELADKNDQIARLVEERAQLRTELVRWQFLAVDTLDRGERALDLSGAPPVPARLAEKLMAQ